MATGREDSGMDVDTLEVGCLHVGLIGARNLRVGGGGMVDLFLNPQVNPYCKITLGGCQFISGVAVKTTAGHAWNREQMFFPVKVPLSCVLGVTGQRDAAEKAKRGSADDGGDVCCRGTAAAAFTKRAGGGHAASSRSYPKSGGGGVGGGVGQGMGGGAYDAWSRLTLRAQVFHREEVKHRGGWGRGTRGGGAKGGTLPCDSRAWSGAGSASHRLRTRYSNNSDRQTELNCRDDVLASNEDLRGGGGGSSSSSSRDRLLGECSINLVGVVSGRVPHIEEWVPLNTEGDLRLSLDYDSVGSAPAPGDSVYPDPTAPRRWTLSRLRDHANATPAAAAIRTAVLCASQEETVWEGSKVVAARALDGLKWTACRWWNGSLARIRDDVLFAVGLMDPDAFVQSEEQQRRREEERENNAIREREIDASPERRQSIDMGTGRAAETPVEGEHAAGSLDTPDNTAEETRLVSDAPSGMRTAVSRHEGDGNFQDEAKPLLSQLRRDDEGTAETKNCEKPVLDSGGSPDTLTSSDALTTASFSAEEAEEISGVGADEAQERTAKVAVEENKGEPAPTGIVAAASADESKGEPASAGSDSAAPAGPSSLSSREQDATPQYLCPITKCPMENPAVASDGYTYERDAIERWLSEHDTSPVTGEILETKVVFKNWSLVSST
eukprot:jgi/Undpi1/11995/HiC_scaffold_4.g01694.m1